MFTSMAGGIYRTSATACLAVCEKVVRHFENISLVHRHEVTSNTEAVKKEIPALHMHRVAQRETKYAATKNILVLLFHPLRFASSSYYFMRS